VIVVFLVFLSLLIKLPAEADESANATPPPNIVPLSDRIPLPMPAFGKSNPLLSTEEQPIAPLSSLAPGSIEVSAKGAESKLKGLTALTISVKNNTDRPLVFNGDGTVATVGGEQLKAQPTASINDRIAQPDNPHGYTRRSIENTITATVTIGAVQTAEGEMIRRGPLASRYGFDNIRRQERQARFAERILWPGDSTEGVVWFKSDKPLSGATLQLPVADYYNKKDTTTLPATVR
jgi:hypothetical protein